MACPKFDRTNKKHVIIAASVAAAVVILIIILIVVIVLTSGDSDSDTGPGTAAQKEGVKRHNELRKKHHSGPLKLTSDLNEKAQQCADYYKKIKNGDHSCPYKGNAGENIYVYRGYHESHIQTDEWHMKKAAEEWFSEIKDYDFSKSYNNLHATGHFTQMIWKGSKELGMGLSKQGIAQVLGVALYEPKGNRDGEYKENVLPE